MIWHLALVLYSDFNIWFILRSNYYSLTTHSSLWWYDTPNSPNVVWAITFPGSRVQLRKPGERASNSRVIFCFLEGHLLPWPISQHGNSSAECNFPSISGPVNRITLLILNFKRSAQVKKCPFISQDSAVNCENRGSTACQDFDREVRNSFVFLHLLGRWHTANR